MLRGLLSPTGVSGKVIDALVADRFKLVVSESILSELAEVMRRRNVRRLRVWTDPEIERQLRVLRRLGEPVPGAYEVDLVPTDPKDNHVVACALEGDADYIVSGDTRDLLPLKAIRVPGHDVVQIVSPAAFLKLLT